MQDGDEIGRRPAQGFEFGDGFHEVEIVGAAAKEYFFHAVGGNGFEDQLMAFRALYSGRE